MARGLSSSTTWCTAWPHVSVSTSLSITLSCLELSSIRLTALFVRIFSIVRSTAVLKSHSFYFLLKLRVATTESQPATQSFWYAISKLDPWYTYSPLLLGRAEPSCVSTPQMSFGFSWPAIVESRNTVQACARLRGTPSCLYSSILCCRCSSLTPDCV